MNDKESIYRAAISVWGKDAQENQAIEEMAELIQAINKMRRQPSPERLDSLKVAVGGGRVVGERGGEVRRGGEGGVQVYGERRVQRLQTGLEDLWKKEAISAGAATTRSASDGWEPIRS